MSSKEFTHIDGDGNVRMVDVGHKAVSHRTAIAGCFISLPDEVLNEFKQGEIVLMKGPVIQTAILAGIMATKKTSSLIPLCHPLPITKCDINIRQKGNGLSIECEVSCDGKTGVEMEALTGAGMAALTIYDMCKSFGHAMEISNLKLLKKTGGKSDFHENT